MRFRCIRATADRTALVDLSMHGVVAKKFYAQSMSQAAYVIKHQLINHPKYEAPTRLRD
jgi:predicted metalloprotease